MNELDKQKEKALEENFQQLNKNFAETFARIVPGGSAELKLVKDESAAADATQKSFPSQFVDASQ